MKRYRLRAYRYGPSDGWQWRVLEEFGTIELNDVQVGVLGRILSDLDYVLEVEEGK